MKRARLLALGVGLAMSAAGCATDVRYSVIPTGTRVTAPPKPPDCPMVFLRTGSQRPYEEISAIEMSMDTNSILGISMGTEEAQRLLGRKACELGADAVIITTDFHVLPESTGVAKMTGVAIKFTDAAPPR